MENQPEQSARKPRPFNRPRRRAGFAPPRRRPSGPGPAAGDKSIPLKEELRDEPREARGPARYEEEEVESSGSESKATITDALREVESIRVKLEGVLEDIEHVLEVLHRAEQEKMGSERELEQLRRSLRSLNRPNRERSSPPPPARYDDPADDGQNS